jgi:hypothetical protein
MLSISCFLLKTFYYILPSDGLWPAIALAIASAEAWDIASAITSAIALAITLDIASAMAWNIASAMLNSHIKMARHYTS